jgi:hypothetical protein
MPGTIRKNAFRPSLTVLSTYSFTVLFTHFNACLLANHHAQFLQVRWVIGNGRLNTSQMLDAYTSSPSTPSSMATLLLLEGCLFSGKASSLDAFRSYPRQLSCSACPVGQLINQRLRCPVPLVLGATSPQTTTPLSGRDRPVSRRSKPSSRSPLMGEQPHPWLLLQNQDGKSRHRGTKPRGR